MNQRNSNFELLRIISIILILLMHIGSMSGGFELNSLNFYIGQFISSIGNIGVTTFILISGYFGVKFKLNKFIHLIYLTTLYSVIVYMLNTILPTNNFNTVDFIKQFFIVPFYKNWFITCYLILMLLAPFLDVLVYGLNKLKFKRMIILLFILFSILPTLFNTPYYTVVTNGGKSLTYFVFIYLVGRYLRLHKDIAIKQKWTFLMFIIAITLINIFNNTASYMLGKIVSIYSMDCSPLILISSISIFYFFKSFKFKSSIINYISSSVLAVYLLDGARVFLDHYTLNINDSSNFMDFLFILLIEVILFFICAIAIDKLRFLFLNKIELYAIGRFISLPFLKKH